MYIWLRMLSHFLLGLAFFAMAWHLFRLALRPMHRRPVLGLLALVCAANGLNSLYQAWSRAEPPLALLITTGLLSLAALPLATNLLRSSLERATYPSEVKKLHDTLDMAYTTAGLASWLWDLKANTVEWSSGSVRLFGFPDDTRLTGFDRVVEATHPDDRARALHNATEAVAVSGYLDHEFRIIRPDGEQRWVLGRGKVFYDAAGEATLMGGINIDITAQKLLEERLRLSEKFNRLIVESSSDIIAVLDESGGVRSLNHFGQEALGTPEPGTGSWIAFWNSTDQAMVQEKFEAARQGNVVRFQASTPADAARRRWWDVILNPMPGPDNRVDQILAISRDITGIKTSEEALKDAESRFRQLADSIQDAFWMLDVHDQRLIYVNTSVQSLYGVSADAISSDHAFHWEVLHPGDRKRAEEKLQTLVRGESIDHEMNIQTGDHSKWIRIRAFPIRAADGRVYRLAGISSDITEQKLIQQRHDRLFAELGHSERKFRDLSNAMPQVVWTSEPDGVVDYFNERWTFFTGIPLTESPSQEWAKALHPDDVARTMEAWKKASETGEGYEMEHRLRRSDGQYRWFLSRALPQKDEAGRIIKWFGTATEITELKEALSALRESEEKFRIMADNIPDCFWMWDVAETRYLYLNKASEGIFGVPSEIMMNFSREEASLLLHPDDRDRAREMVERQLQGFDTEEELRFIRNGEEFCALVRGVPIRDEAGTIIRVVGTTSDISARKKAEHEKEQVLEELTTERARLNLVLQHMPAGVIVVEAPDGRIVLHNRKAEEILGHPMIPADLARYEVYRGFHRDGRPYRGDEYPSARALQGDTVIDHEMSYKRDDGVLTDIVISASPILNGRGETIAAAVVFHDVSERRKAEKEREKLIFELQNLTHELRLAKEKADSANQSKSQFLANMSHEIRTPLTAIMGFAEFLKEPDIAIEERLEFVAIILRNGTNLSRLIDDILDLSKVESGRMDVERVLVSIHEMLDELHHLFAQQAHKKGLELTMTAAPNIPRFVMVDPTRLRQILVNIIGNALKFTHEGSVVVTSRLIAADSAKPLLEFVIRDTGVGLSQDQQAKLFQPFTQADSSTTRLYGGTGLGLVLSRRLAQLLGGSLVLAESREGEGSCFVVTVDPSLDMLSHAGTRNSADRGLHSPGRHEFGVLDV